MYMQQPVTIHHLQEIIWQLIGLWGMINLLELKSSKSSAVIVVHFNTTIFDIRYTCDTYHAFNGNESLIEFEIECQQNETWFPDSIPECECKSLKLFYIRYLELWSNLKLFLQWHIVLKTHQRYQTKWRENGMVILQKLETTLSE